MPCIRIAGSPDAPADRAAAYAKAWKGDRVGGELVSRVKAALALLELSGVPPVEASAPEPAAPDAPAEPDMFADEPPHDPVTGEIRAPVDAPAERRATFNPKDESQWRDRIREAGTVADCLDLGYELAKKNGSHLSVQTFERLRLALETRVNQLKAQS